MDRVRLGRVLGRGARMAARTVYDAVDAATAPAGESPRQRPISPEPRPAQHSAPAEHNDRAGALHDAVRTAGRVQGSVRAARQGVLTPVKRASHAVSLEIAGSFFALFAISFSVAAWRFRNPADGSAMQRMWMCVGLAALFAYFALSSFLRARRLSRR